MGLKDGSIVLIIAVVMVTSTLLLLYPSSLTGKVIWMEQGDELKVLDSGTGIVRDVQFYDVAGQNRTPICGFIVDGEHIWIEEGKDNELMGIKIYVRKVVLVRDQLEDKDVCKVAFANVIVMMNESEEVADEEENGTAQEVIMGEPVEQDVEETAMAEPAEYEMPPAEEKPAKTGLFSRVIGWIKSLFLSLNVPSR